MKLIATYPILYHSKQYRVGEELPTNDPNMVQAWLDAGTAAWQDGEHTAPAKAVPVTAEPGLAGESPNGETDENVVGRIPKTPARTRSKGGKKSD